LRNFIKHAKNPKTVVNFFSLTERRNVKDWQEKGQRRIQKGMNGYRNGSEDPIQRQTRTGNGL